MFGLESTLRKMDLQPNDMLLVGWLFDYHTYWVKPWMCFIVWIVRSLLSHSISVLGLIWGLKFQALTGETVWVTEILYCFHHADITTISSLLLILLVQSTPHCRCHVLLSQLPRMWCLPDHICYFLMLSTLLPLINLVLFAPGVLWSTGDDDIF